MSFLSQFVRVTAAMPCPICRKPDYCVVSVDGTIALCTRVESKTQFKSAGYLHALVGPPITVVQPTVETRPEIPQETFRHLVQEHRACVQPDPDGQYLQELGFSAEAAMRLEMMGFDDALGWPMTDGFGKYLGIRFRASNGRKWSLKGGKEGLFVPVDIDRVSTRVVYLPEGPTDTAALLTCGITAIGRPNNIGGVDLLRRWLSAHPLTKVVIVGDNDPPDKGRPGHKGACHLAAALGAFVLDIVSPRHYKDVRDMISHFVTAESAGRVIMERDPSWFTKLTLDSA